jgi:hypothetical protein
MTITDTSPTEIRPTITIDGLEVEAFETEEEAQACWNAIPSLVAHNAAAFVAATTHIVSECEEAGPRSAILERVSCRQA